jgi:hypothetical protein
VSDHPMPAPVPHRTPWYESNLVWGPVNFGTGIVLAVVAAMKHDLRWLLIFAWVCLSLAAFFGSRQAKLRRRLLAIVAVAAAVLFGCLLLVINHWLQPPKPLVPAKAETQPLGVCPSNQP